jgi:hypothetical protein
MTVPGRTTVPFHQCIALAGTLAKDQKEEIVSEIEKAWLERFGGQTTRVGR